MTLKKEFVDQIGNIVSLQQPPKRIVSLVPSQTELLFYLGLKEEVVGITKFCIHPDEMFRSKVRVLISLIQTGYSFINCSICSWSFSSLFFPFLF